MKPVVLNSLRVLRAAIDDLRAPRRVASGTMHSQQRSDHLYVRCDGELAERVKYRATPRMNQKRSVEN